MIRLHRWHRWLALALLGAVGLGLWFFWPRAASLRRFDPSAMAALEARMWRSYYESRRVALVRDLYRMSRQQYGFSPWASVRIAWHAAQAALRFQPTRSRVEAEAALPALERHFAVIRTGTGERFDVGEVARLELDWWQLRRENKTWEEYAPAVAKVSAAVYGISEGDALTSARLRSEMMAFRDARRDRAISKVEWSRIEEGLRESWERLRTAVSAP